MRAAVSTVRFLSLRKKGCVDEIDVTNEEFTVGFTSVYRTRSILPPSPAPVNSTWASVEP